MSRAKSSVVSITKSEEPSSMAWGFGATGSSAKIRWIIAKPRAAVCLSIFGLSAVQNYLLAKRRETLTTCHHNGIQHPYSKLILKCL